MGIMKKGKRGIIYTRFSPRRAAEECRSCEWQADECRRYAETNGYEVAAVYDDPDVSGADAVRPELWAAIEALNRGDALIVWKWDRLARDLILALQIERAVQHRGAVVVATTGDIPGDDPHAQFTRHILMAVAELERRMIKQRTSAAMLALQRSGKRMSDRTPYGWKTDPKDYGRLVEDAGEQYVRRKILEWRDRGYGYRKICGELEKNGVKTRMGGKWQVQTVRNIILRG